MCVERRGKEGRRERERGRDERWIVARNTGSHADRGWKVCMWQGRTASWRARDEPTLQPQPKGSLEAESFFLWGTSDVAS